MGHGTNGGRGLGVAVAWATVAVMLLAGPGAAQQPGAQQRLGLGDALHRARTGAFGNRIAAGESTERSADAVEALRGMLPTVRVESGYMRTTDPIGAFGTLLRQRSITQADFDPSRLSYPATTPTYSAAVVVEQPLVNADAWLGRSAASTATEASRESESWTLLGTSVDVVRAYFGAVLASETVATLESASRAAHRHVSQTESMAEQGLVTRSDALLASVKAGEVDAQRIAATGAASLARRGLATLLGEPGATAFSLPPALPSAEAVRVRLSEVLPSDVPQRAEVAAADPAGDDRVRGPSVLS